MTKERDLFNNPKIPKRKEVKLGTDIRSVPVPDKQTSLTCNPTTQPNEQRHLTIAEQVVPAIPDNVGLIKRDVGFVRESVFKAFDDAGGHSAFAVWASENPTEFYRLFVGVGKVFDNKPTQATQIIVQSNIPSNPLDANTSQSVTIVGSGTFNVVNELDGEDEDEEDDE